MITRREREIIRRRKRVPGKRDDTDREMTRTAWDTERIRMKMTRVEMTRIEMTRIEMTRIEGWLGSRDIEMTQI